MQTDLRELISLVLRALPQAALVVSKRGEVVLRNAAAETLLPGGDEIAGVLRGGSPAEIDWPVEMQALAEGAGRLVRRNVRLLGRGSRQVLADVYLRGMGVCLAVCEPNAAAIRSTADGAACAIVADWAGGGEPSAEAPAAADPAGAADRECVLVLVEDVAPRVSMQRRLAADRRLAAAGTLAAKVAHELNSPLDGVLRYIGLAERSSGAQAQEHLAHARAGLLRMAEIVRGLLARGRPRQTAGERAAVQTLLDEAVTVMQPRAQALGVSVVCDLADEVDGLVEGSVFQVFCNVIKNALDAMPNGGVLTIRLRPAGEQCLVEFADTGCGLTDEEAKRIFEPFYTTKPPGEGSGLGLAICREIVGRIGGSITAGARPEGGAAVAVRLPCHRPWLPTEQEQ